jgi:predicted aspartyl protease
MADLDGRPLVKVDINGKGPYTFILDTGADETVIDEDLKKELSLETVQTAGPEPGTVRIRALGIGGATLEGVIIKTFLPHGMFGGSDAPRGVLSAASFPGYLVVLDYPGKRILIRKGELPGADSRTRFQYTRDQILPNVPIRVAGTEVRMHVDSGSPGSITLPTKFLKEVPLASDPTQIGTARTAYGTFPVWTAEIKGAIELGQYQLDPKINFSDVNPLPGPPTGNLGYRALRQFVITLDSKNRRIQFER